MAGRLAQRRPHANLADDLGAFLGAVLVERAVDADALSPLADLQIKRIGQRCGGHLLDAGLVQLDHRFHDLAQQGHVELGLIPGEFRQVEHGLLLHLAVYARQLAL
ncbi:hypothetical protein D3C79_860710 [compost metagenome]